MTGRQPLTTALARGLAPDGDLFTELHARRGSPLCRADARALCAALARVTASSLRDAQCSCPENRLHLLASLFQNPQDQVVSRVLARDGVPQLVRLYDEELALPDGDDHNLLFLLKVLALYRSRAGLLRLVEAARSRFADRYLWSVIFNVFDAEHPLRHEACDELRNPLPEGFVAVAYLDFVNQLAIRGELGEHPFDSPQGREALHRHLTSDNPAETSYAVSAAVAAPFLGQPDREQLLALALDHPSSEVQMEAAWASARLGSRGGVKCLARLCLDPRTSATACAYLTELDRDDDIPAEVYAPDFQALAGMCQWLAHPGEIGTAPDEVEIVDTREVDWPPTNDRRRLWLVRYRYQAGRTGPQEQSGVGLVGSITFVLFGETSADMPPDDVYAYHCCWELQFLGDRAAPAERCVDAGRRLLGWEGAGQSVV